jgi:hypothetical protein
MTRSGRAVDRAEPDQAMSMPPSAAASARLASSWLRIACESVITCRVLDSASALKIRVRIETTDRVA